MAVPTALTVSTQQPQFLPTFYLAAGSL